MRALLAVAVALGAIVLAPPDATARPRAAVGDYVALGDSFTAGPLIPNQLPDPLGCLRSDHDYPHRLAAAVAPSGFRDVSCSGADTTDMFAAQHVSPGPNPPQLDALSPSTTLVTLGIGGNDIGFSEIIQGCATLVPWQTPCRDRYVVNGRDELSERIRATAPKVASVLASIRARSPQATVLVVGYPTILPDSGYGCWPSMPIRWGDVSYLRAKHKELNAMLQQQAGAAGMIYIDVYRASLGRDACASSSSRWVEPFVPANPAAPVHPNARGMQGMADVLTQAVNVVAAG